MLRKQAINFDWLYCEKFNEDFMNQGGNDEGFISVHIPHTNKELPLNNFDEKDYQFESYYKKNIQVESLNGTRLFIRFEAVMTYAKVYINGQFVGEHKGGYTGFEFDITEFVNEGENNIIGVYVDSNERSDIPPFGHVIDYLTYGGIYREVALIYRNPCYVENIRVKTKNELTSPTIDVTLEIANIFEAHIDALIEMSLLYKGEVIGSWSKQVVINGKSAYHFLEEVGDVDLWSVDQPNLYTIEVDIIDQKQVLDHIEERIGFRQFEFKKDGFYQNGRRIKIIGLNRHQSYPYVGYAMPKSAQYKDADILKNELKVNAVRLSHYPQSDHFLDRCDEIGLLVFDEIPGWQHIGDEEWQRVAYQHVEEMIKKDQNRPSVFIWGTRINESNDDHEFYKKTSDIARGLDDSRPVGGVRCIKNSELLEDVYTFNDFSHTGDNLGLENPSKVFKEDKPYLVTEYNGHMYPTKKYDDEAHRISHALRHANVLESIYSNDRISGGIGWCMFDYNTHKDFGSGDKICYHGVMDMFRIPKMASHVYASQQVEEPVIHVASSMSIGEYAGGFLQEINVFTNCDEIKLFNNDTFIRSYYTNRDRYKHLPFPPIVINDFIGDRIDEEEGFAKKDGALVKRLLMKANQTGGKLNFINNLQLGWVLLKYKLSPLDAENLYTKYFGGWGDEATSYTVEGYRNGQRIKSVTKGQIFKPTLVCNLDSELLIEDETYDVTRVIVRMVDEYGNDIHYANDAFTIEVSEHIDVIGPKTIGLIGGSIGFWVKTTGVYGDGNLKIISPRFGIIEKHISVKKSHPISLD